MARFICSEIKGLAEEYKDDLFPKCYFSICRGVRLSDKIIKFLDNDPDIEWWEVCEIKHNPKEAELGEIRITMIPRKREGVRSPKRIKLAIENIYEEDKY